MRLLVAISSYFVVPVQRALLKNTTQLPLDTVVDHSANNNSPRYIVNAETRNKVLSGIRAGRGRVTNSTQNSEHGLYIQRPATPCKKKPCEGNVDKPANPRKLMRKEAFLKNEDVEFLSLALRGFGCGSSQ